ncbi:hypothetical protein Pelo_12644 [Pelomyxa schiedti]|nr:hypothetical protein Pelo_12644 [Pelomyxa schiedti]
MHSRMQPRAVNQTTQQQQPRSRAAPSRQQHTVPPSSWRGAERRASTAPPRRPHRAPRRGPSSSSMAPPAAPPMLPPCLLAPMAAPRPPPPPRPRPARAVGPTPSPSAPPWGPLPGLSGAALATTSTEQLRRLLMLPSGSVSGEQRVRIVAAMQRLNRSAIVSELASSPRTCNRDWAPLFVNLQDIQEKSWGIHEWSQQPQSALTRASILHTAQQAMQLLHCLAEIAPTNMREQIMHSALDTLKDIDSPTASSNKTRHSEITLPGLHHATGNSLTQTSSLPTKRNLSEINGLYTVSCPTSLKRGRYCTEIETYPDYSDYSSSSPEQHSSSESSPSQTQQHTTDSTEEEEEELELFPPLSSCLDVVVPHAQHPKRDQPRNSPPPDPPQQQKQPQSGHL